MRPQYLRVRNWERFQHYKDRRPPWIKLHVEMLDDYELTHLTYATQLLYDRLLLLAARTDNNIPHDPEWIATQTHILQVSVVEGVESLVVERFLSISDTKRSASRALARSKQPATPRALARDREETETDAETENKIKRETRAVPLKANAQPSDLAIARTIDFSLKGAA